MTLRVSLIIEGEAGDAKKALDDIKRGLEGTGSQGKKTTEDSKRGFASMRGGIDAARGSLNQFRSILTLVATGAMTLFVKRSTDFGDEIAKSAQQLGLTNRKIQEYRTGAALAGVSQEDLNTALRFFGKELGGSENDVTEFHKALGQLGLRFGDLKKAGLDRALETVSDRLSTITDVTERNRIAFDLYSRTGIKAVNFLASGAKEMKSFADEARRLGLILSDETLKKSEEANDEFTRIGTALRVAGVNIAVGFLPALTSIKTLVTDPGFQAGLKSIAGGVGELVNFLAANGDKLLIAATAFAGMKAGAAVGGALFGPRGAVVAGGLGLVGGLVAGAELAKKKVSDLEEELGRLLKKQQDLEKINRHPEGLGRFEQVGIVDQLNDVRLKIAAKRVEIEAEAKKVGAALSGDEGPLKVKVGTKNVFAAFFPQIDLAIGDLKLKRGELEGTFKGFADGFGGLLKGLNLTGVGDADIFRLLSSGAASLKGQIKELYTEFTAFLGAQMRLDLATPYERMNREIEKARALLVAGGIDQETFNRKVLSLKFPGLTQMVGELSNLSGVLDQTLVGGLNSMSGAFADVFAGIKSGKDAMRDFGKQALRSLGDMLFKLTVILPLANALRGAFGGLGGLGGGLGKGGLFGGFIIPGILHGGGRGRDAPSSGRLVPVAAFDGARRFHDGKPAWNPATELPAIIRKEEEVGYPAQLARKYGGGVTLNQTNNYSSGITPSDRAWLAAQADRNRQQTKAEMQQMLVKMNRSRSGSAWGD